MNDPRPKILLVIPSGEAVRNFLYSDALEQLSAEASVTLLSAVHDDDFRQEFSPLCEEIVALHGHQESSIVTRLRFVIHMAHMRWIWSKVFQNNWEARSAEARERGGRWRVRWAFLRVTSRLLGHRRPLERLTAIERRLSFKLRPTREFDELLDRLQPDLVFNGMHVHGPTGDLPMRVAAAKGYRTAAFIYSWDNLTSRSRIFVPYDEFLLWTEAMRSDLLAMYDTITPGDAHVTGTPQFDFHNDPEQLLPVDVLADKLGFDGTKPFVLYTTGVDRHFKEEHRTVKLVADTLARIEPGRRPQLVVRTYVKGTSPEMRELMTAGLADTVFPNVEWDEKWFTPTRDDLAVYSSLLHHCEIGINAASTVSLELLALGKPVINLGFDPPGSNLDVPDRWIRHIEFDHFAPVAASGATRVALSPEDIGRFLTELLADPTRNENLRRDFIAEFLGPIFDGKNGSRAAETLLSIARAQVEARQADMP